MNRLLDKLEKKLGKFAIPELMLYIVGGMMMVALMDIVILPKMGYSLVEKLAFDKEAIFAGEVWRIISFILIPENENIFFIIFSAYFYWMVGSGLEANWGAFRFNAYYFMGILLTIVSGFITGYATNTYLNLTLFLAFAVIYPDYELRLFFFIPVKVKVLAIIDAALMAVLLIWVPWQSKLALIIAFGNFLLFFIPDIILRIKAFYRRRKYKREMRDYYKN